MLYLVKSGKISFMKPRVTEAAYQKAFFAKVKFARHGAGYTAPEMAELLGISKDKYYRYESRHMMRHDLIPVFCDVTKTDVIKLMSPPASTRKIKRAE